MTTRPLKVRSHMRKDGVPKHPYPTRELAMAGPGTYSVYQCPFCLKYHRSSN